MGAYYQLLTPGIPELGGWVYMGPYDPEAYWYEFTGIVTNSTPTDAYRGAGRPEATYVIERLVDTFARRIGKDPAEVRRMNLKPRVRGGDHRDLRPQRRLRQLRGRRSTRRWGWSSTTSSERSSATPRERGDTQAARDRPLDLHRDVRPGALEHPGRAPIRGRRLGRRDDRVPADRQGAGEDGHLTARPGARDHVVPDRGRRARGDTRRHRGAPRRHADHAPRDGHVRIEVGLRRRCGAPLRGREGEGEGADDRGARARGLRGRPRVGRGVVRTSPALPTRRRPSPRSRSPRGTRTSYPRAPSRI